MHEPTPVPASYTLSDLGITSTANGDHRPRYSISLGAAEAAKLGASKLVFNPATKTWTTDDTAPSIDTVQHLGQSRVNGIINRAADSTVWHDYLPNTEHVSFFRNVNWQASPLGPMESWPLSLQSFVTFMMTDTNAAALYWGPQLTAVYNLGMLNLSSIRLQKNKDMIMGCSFADIWSELWQQMEPLLERVRETGEPADSIDIDLYPMKDGYLEETFWTASFMSIRGLDGRFLGYYNRGREVTKEVVAERRTRTLTDIASFSGVEGELVWSHLFNAFRANERDFPMAFVYQATEDLSMGRCQLELKQSIGLPENGHELVPKLCDLYKSQDGFFTLFRRAKFSDKPLVLHKHEEPLLDSLLRGFEWKGFGEPSRSIAVLAIRSGDRTLGMLVVALNPRQPYDAEYEGFLNSLGRHASATVVHAIDHEEAKIRGQRLAQQLEKSDAQIRDMAVYGPVGMLRVAPNGKILWANDQFYEITGHGRNEEDQYELSFVDVVAPEDQPLSAGYWPDLVDKRQKINVALRLKKRWKPPSALDGTEAEDEPVWINAVAYPIIEEDEVRGVAGAITDISYYKWAEATQSRSAVAAKEAKRLQENFIDIVSHEMRNPLSAITQLADEIASSLDNTPVEMDTPTMLEIIKSNVSSAQTILLCAAHQKRIVDDVLTLSKLEAMMLSITPVVVQPAKVVETVAKMFDGETATNGIQLTRITDSSYAQNEIDWVCIDPSRLSQILINLIGNAIKFTKAEKQRVIKIRLGATLSRPTTLAGVQWFPTEKKYRDPTQGPEWGSGDAVYLCFEVEDTGRGLEKEEMSKLFGKFQQATAKTHIKYGGSGLGLFISRELTETQGGEIGAESKPGVGSTFAFYIKGRKAEPPEEPVRVVPPPLALPMRNNVPSKSVENQRPQHATKDKIIPPQTVLLVEDNVVNAQVLTRQLERSNVRVFLANHGVEALDFLKNSRAWKDRADDPDAVELSFVLMDVEMPVMDGLTCARRIRQLENEGLLVGHTNIIAITANARQEQIDTILQAGMDDVMPKPFRVKDLLQRMHETNGGT